MIIKVAMQPSILLCSESQPESCGMQPDLWAQEQEKEVLPRRKDTQGTSLGGPVLVSGIPTAAKQGLDWEVYGVLDC